MEKTTILGVVLIILSTGIFISGIITIGNREMRKNTEMRIKEREVCINAGHTYHFEYSNVICN